MIFYLEVAPHSLLQVAGGLLLVVDDSSTNDDCGCGSNGQTYTEYKTTLPIEEEE